MKAPARYPLAIVDFDCAFGEWIDSHSVASAMFEARQTQGRFSPRKEERPLHALPAAFLEEEILRRCKQFLDALCIYTERKRIGCFLIVPNEDDAPRDVLHAGLASKGLAFFAVADLAEAFCQAEQKFAHGLIDMAVFLSWNRLPSLADLEPAPYTATFSKRPALVPVTEGFALLALEPYEKAREARRDLFASVQGPFFAEEASLKAVALETLYRDALDTISMSVGDLGFFNSSGRRETEIAETVFLARSLGKASHRTCALGAARATFGDVGAVNDLAAFIYALLSVRYRMFPAIPNWEGPRAKQLEAAKGVFVPSETLPWLTHKKNQSRMASITFLTAEQKFGLLFIKEEQAPPFVQKTLVQNPLWLCPIPFDHLDQLEKVLASALEEATGTKDLEEIAYENVQALTQRTQTPFLFSVVASSKESFLHELRYAVKHAAACLRAGKAWKTPAGSYCTAQPLGADRTLAFLYPGIGSAYTGLGRGLFQLFPLAFDRMQEVMGDDAHKLFCVDLLYPKSTKPLNDLSSGNEILAQNMAHASHVSMSVCSLYTGVLREVFHIQPAFALGYSLGEGTMMTALRLFSSGMTLSKKMEDLGLLTKRLGGEQQALRAYWKLSPSDPRSGKELWQAFILKVSSPTYIRQLLQDRDDVFLLATHTAHEVMIGGRPDRCEEFITMLQAQAMPVPAAFPIHCKAMNSEQNRLKEAYHVPVQEQPDLLCYSSACYAPISHRQPDIAESLALANCHHLDFPRLVERVYEDGARIFLELGPRQVCSHWVHEILEDRSHLALGINQPELDEHTSLIRALAQLISHRVPCDLKRLIDLMPRRNRFACAGDAQRASREARGTSDATPTSATEKELHGSPINEMSKWQRALSFLPRTVARKKLLKELRERVAKLLDLPVPDMIDPDVPLYELGIDSIKGASLFAQVQAQWGLAVSPKEVFSHPTLNALSDFLVDQVKTSLHPSSAKTVKPEVNLEQEAQLDAGITLSGPSGKTGEAATHLLLTGATGFLGAFLLHELLQQTDADVYCVVRADSHDAATGRLASNLQRYGLWKETLHDRIHPLIGDLASPRFGWSEARFDELAEKIDRIYHNGAMLHFVYPYEALSPANVGGTETVLRFACHKRTKPVHYVSTVAVFESEAYHGKTVNEKEPLTHWQGMRLGYSQTKWVAEQYVQTAAERGLPVTIYRPGPISGHQQTGAWNLDDVTCMVIKGCVQMGAMAEADFCVDLAPVDYVSRAIVRLSLNNGFYGTVFHLNNPQPMAWHDLIGYTRNKGLDIEVVSEQEWLRRVVGGTLSPENSLYPLVPFFASHLGQAKLFDGVYGSGGSVRIDCNHTVNCLAKLGIHCPPVDRGLLDRYWDYFIEQSFIDLEHVPSERADANA